jgi:hypothetical protein
MGDDPDHAILLVAESGDPNSLYCSSGFIVLYNDSLCLITRRVTTAPYSENTRVGLPATTNRPMKWITLGEISDWTKGEASLYHQDGFMDIHLVIPVGSRVLDTRLRESAIPIDRLSSSSLTRLHKLGVEGFPIFSDPRGKDVPPSFIATAFAASEDVNLASLMLPSGIWISPGPQQTFVGGPVFMVAESGAKGMCIGMYVGRASQNSTSNLGLVVPARAIREMITNSR